jgi:hypothetical protein
MMPFEHAATWNETARREAARLALARGLEHAP